jgi:1-acyl-sn-glycerol-3-phosphate acyltransferase
MKARKFFNAILRLLARLFLRLEVQGLENIPEQGATILMINHIHFLDPFVTVAASPRLVTVMSKVENFSIPIFGLIFKLYGVIPVERGAVDRQALRRTFAALKKGEALLLAPEGTRSPNRALQSAHNGLAYIAQRSQAVIVPVAITGVTRFIPTLKHLRRTPVHIKLGQPFYLRAPLRRLGRETLTAMTTEAMYRLAAALPPDYRGHYADLERATQEYIHWLKKEASTSPEPCGGVESRGRLSEV